GLANAANVGFQARIREGQRRDQRRAEAEQSAHARLIVLKIRLIFLIDKGGIIDTGNARLRGRGKGRIRVLHLRSAHEPDQLVEWLVAQGERLVERLRTARKGKVIELVHV